MALGLLAGCMVADGQLDERGTIEIVIDGEPVDLTADRFQSEHAEDASIAFHLHEGDEHWYMEGEERLTVGAALDLVPHIGFSADGDAPVVTVDGTTYDATEPGTTVEVRVDGEAVDPTTYRLRDGDHIEVVVGTDA